MTTLNNPAISKLYQSVPAFEIEKLQRFRDRYPYQSATIDGETWRYLDASSDDSDTVILVLSGALCIAEISWHTIERLAEKYRVIAPDYNAVSTADALVVGMARILDHAGVERAHVMGGSYGGAVAQVFVRRYPERAISMIASHTMCPSPERGEKLRKWLRWMRWLPGFALRGMLGRSLGGLTPDEGQPELALMVAHVREVIKYRLSKRAILALFQRSIDFDLNYTFGSDDLKDWPGKVLLMLSEDDPATPEPVRAQLIGLYPEAEVHLFRGAGHATSLLQQDEYIGTVEAFIE